MTPRSVASVIPECRNARGPGEALLIAGLPIKEPVARMGPIVMNTRAELAQAFEDYQSGRLGAPEA